MEMSNRKYWYFRFCENCFSDEKIRNMDWGDGILKNVMLMPVDLKIGKDT